MKSIDSKISPEQNLSRQRIPLDGDDTIVRKIARRTSEKAVLNSSRFSIPKPPTLPREEPIISIMKGSLYIDSQIASRKYKIPNFSQKLI